MNGITKANNNKKLIEKIPKNLSEISTSPEHYQAIHQITFSMELMETGRREGYLLLYLI